jgi:DNA-binding NarL/FixJ family response regulator
MEKNQLLESVSKKLGVLIALNLISMNQKATITDNVGLLLRFGLSSGEIAEILNTSKGTVDVVKSRLKVKNK